MGYLYRIVKHFLNFCIVTMDRRLAGSIHSPMIVSSVAHNGSRTEIRIYNLHYALIRQNNEITNVINLYVTRACNSRLYIELWCFAFCIVYYIIRLEITKIRAYKSLSYFRLPPCTRSANKSFPKDSISKLLLSYWF